MSDPPDKDKPVEFKMWLEEARRQFDLAHKIDQQLTNKIQWLLGLFISTIVAVATIWELVGIPTNIWLMGTLIGFTIIGLVFFWKIANTNPSTILGVYKEISKYNEKENNNSDYQYWRLIQGLDDAVSKIDANNEINAMWYERTLGLIIVIMFFLIISFLVI